VATAAATSRNDAGYAIVFMAVTGCCTVFSTRVVSAGTNAAAPAACFFYALQGCCWVKHNVMPSDPGLAEAMQASSWLEGLGECERAWQHIILILQAKQAEQWRKTTDRVIEIPSADVSSPAPSGCNSGHQG
jgi:hypothetical protein